ncbi:uncharacterized protein F4822DRAFT_418629 [Hypoxylon trugodes]|uniref:uncharacterized protein n=1 Tax=Hypoxylon trugodes TaxID=326681 RepID=UPI0021974F27|nr:uncharacterized protein F4822DRAFT_418629 [Hypoxylon trugodes]KAI1384097.1 hypothetical protein F4822DRAFT_418629 [Hypoxylon trugodes]
MDNKKRRPSYSELSTLPDDFKMFQPIKRHRFVDYSNPFDTMDFEPTVTRPPFFIIKEANSRPSSSGFEQVMVENSFATPYHAEAIPRTSVPFENFRVRPPSDSPGSMNYSVYVNGHDEAAKLVEADLADSRRRSRLSQHERILRSLIRPKSPEAEFDIDDVALQGIFYAANEIFFRGRLKGRVAWAWGDLPSSLIGTTALRKSPLTAGYETLIFLSQGILKDRKYNRRLLISTFIHELIHSYLFVLCGFQSSECGGHTDGFQRIARLIDDWAGPGLLYLNNMEAELNNFETRSTVLPKGPIFDGCGGGSWSHDPAPGDYVFRPQCRLRPVVRLLDRDLLG